ncbi:hypothetical protein ZWY2020_022059 [Hordeum vulgare]|nr:hypothetical protein ZWY2020_022059 [Hordeum vulgare]
MRGSHKEEIDCENLTNHELNDKFQQMMSNHVQDFVTTFGEAMDKLDGMEKKFDTNMNAKFNEVLSRLPPPAAASVPLQPQQRLRARRVLVNQMQNFVGITPPAAAPPADTTEVSVAE